MGTITGMYPNYTASDSFVGNSGAYNSDQGGHYAVVVNGPFKGPFSVTTSSDCSITGGTGGSYAFRVGGVGGVGGNGVLIHNAASDTLTNNGVITGGAGGFALTPGAGGSGVYGSEAAGTVVNNNTIIGGNGGANGYGGYGGGGAGVDLTGGGYVSNTGNISGGGGYIGGAGVDLNGGVLTTSGSISGGIASSSHQVADAVYFGSSTSTLNVDPGAVFNGQVAGNYYNDTLELSGIEAGGTPITLGSQFTGFEALYFASGAAWTVDATTASLSDPPGIDGFAKGDTLDVTDLTPSPSQDSFNYTTDVMTLSNGDILQFDGTFTPGEFLFTPDASGNGTDITLACYCRGTRVKTASGETPVENLAVSDLVLTATGELRPIRWLGSRAIDCTRYPNPAAVWPIRIQAGAFGEDLPARDLCVSPGHSMLVEGVLVQAEKLVNGATIVQVPCARVEYWHVELDSHDILFAEGLPAESYLDTGNRMAFVNGGAYLEAYPDFGPKHWSDTCVPLVLEGPAVQRAKSALLARAHVLGYAMTKDADVHVVADGKRIDAVALSRTRLAFMLPAALSTIELRCRSFTPAHIDPASNDSRSLGICVGRLQCDGTDVLLKDDTALALGWHALEQNSDGRQWRWCRDRASLPAATRLVVIDLFGPGFYWAEPIDRVSALFG